VAKRPPDLPPQCVRELTVATLGCMQALGGEAMLIGEDGEPSLIRLARIKPRLVLTERPGDHATSRPRRITMYRTAELTPGEPFKLGPDAALFILHEKGFYRPPDWHLIVLEDPRRWYNATMLTLWAALEPVLATLGHTEPGCAPYG
jgi:hypothetical protein